MVRFKFLVFALLAILLWVVHLTQVSSATLNPAVEQGGAHARAGAQAAGRLAEEARAQLAELSLAVASSPKFAQLARAPAAERATQLAALAAAAAPEALGPSLVVGAGSDSSVQFARADGAEMEALEPAVIGAGPGADVFEVSGAPHLFRAIPLTTGADGKPTLSAALGLPLTFSPEALEALRAETGLEALAVVRGAEVVAKAGEAADASLAIPAGAPQVIERGQPSRVFGLPSPLFAGEGGAPLRVAARAAVSGTPYEVVAVSSLAPTVSALVGYQGFALPALAGLVLLSVVWTALMGRGQRRETEEEETFAAGPPAEAPPAEAAATAAPVVAAEAEAAFAAAPAPVAGEATFEPAPSAPAPQAEPSEWGPPPTGAEFPFPTREEAPPAPGLAAPSQGAYAFGEPATATGAHPPPEAALVPPPESYEHAGAEPEATRVAMIPQHLIDASARASHTALGLQAPAAVAPPPPQVAPSVAPAIPAARNDEEQHFQDVFREFLSTRERTGEGNDGLTYDKFVQKLRKNKEQLVQKYACKTVRFQVYMKEGKAALKATPVRE